MAISNAIDAGAVARVLGIKTNFINLQPAGTAQLPQRVGVVGQGSTSATYPTTKQIVTSATQAATLYGYGSPVHLAVNQLLPANGNGVGSIPVTVFPLEDAATATASTITVTASGVATATAEYSVKVNNITTSTFAIPAGATADDAATAIAAAVQASINLPVTATAAAAVATLTSKWAGASANSIIAEVSDPDAGITFAVTTATGGTVDPEVTPALNLVGEVWETMFVNCLDSTNVTALDEFSTFGEGRWGAITRKPCVVFTGNTDASATTATAITDTRTIDRTNSQVVSPGAQDLPLVVAAGQVSQIVSSANSNPAKDYGYLVCAGLTPGADVDQWDYPTRDAALKAGTSTVEVRAGQVTTADIVTMYHPLGEQNPAYRYVVDIVKIQNILFNLDLIFATQAWAGAPLIPDNQATVNPAARTPKSAKVEVFSMIDALALNALISDPESAKAATFAEIDSSNPKRLNLTTTVKLSGNANVISMDLNFGFLFGGAS